MLMKKLKGPNNRAVRLHHPTYRNCLLAIEEPGRPYPEPYTCPHCKITHDFKMHHLLLDANGDTTLHEIMYEYLRDLGLLRDLKAMEEVEPQPQTISIADFKTEDNVVSNERGPIRLNGMNGNK